MSVSAMATRSYPDDDVYSVALIASCEGRFVDVIRDKRRLAYSDIDTRKGGTDDGDYCDVHSNT
jgi:hypothetical protein